MGQLYLPNPKKKAQAHMGFKVQARALFTSYWGAD